MSKKKKCWTTTALIIFDTQDKWVRVLITLGDLFAQVLIIQTYNPYLDDDSLTELPHDQA